MRDLVFWWKKSGEKTSEKIGGKKSQEKKTWEMDNPNLTKVICLTGGPCGGKTSCLAILSE